jgi:predicted membrane channel-forming protein YqfA (hemolysin III family)
VLTLPAKILNYISAYMLLYPLLIIRIVFLRQSNETVADRITANIPFLVALFLLCILSITWVTGLLKWKNNTRIKGAIVENITMEMAAFLASYIIPLIFIDVNWVLMITFIVIYIAVGIACVFADKHFPNPTFLFFRYRMYKVGDGYILFRGSMDSLKLLTLEQPDGICARELVPNAYIVLPQ